MSERVEQMFSQLRRGPWNVDPSAVPQEGFGGNGNVESQGWLSDGSVTADVIQANAVIAGKVDADAITAREIAANTITAAEIAANTITASEIAANAITASELAANSVVAGDLQAGAVTAGTIAADVVTATEIAALTITASEIAADAITTTKILAANVTSSRMEVSITGKNFGANTGSAASPGYYFDAASNYGLFYVDNVSPIPDFLGVTVAGSKMFHFAPGGVSVGGVLDPSADNTYGIGASGLRWTDVWAVDGTINTSDARLKTDIADSPLGLDFVRSLRPVSYRWRDTPDTQARAELPPASPALDSEKRELVATIERVRRDQIAGRISDEKGNRIVLKAQERLGVIREEIARPWREAHAARRPGRRQHYGLIAQEVKAALDAAGVDAAFWKVGPDGQQSLAYSELIAPLIAAVQEMAARVEALEAQA